MKASSFSLIVTTVQHGSWSHLLTKPTLLPYHRNHHVLSVIDNCLMWGRRVVSSQVFRQSLLQELHSNCLGITKMKALARNYLW